MLFPFIRRIYQKVKFQNMAEVDRKKPFSSLEKDLFLNIIQNYEAILTSKQTNATSALKKKHSWEKIAEEFNESSIVTQKASTKQLIKLLYNMKAKARESKTKENIRYLTGGGPSVVDMDPIDSKVMDIDKNILTNIAVDIDSDIDGSIVILGDNNNKAWCKTPDATMEMSQEDKEIEFKTTIKKTLCPFSPNSSKKNNTPEATMQMSQEKKEIEFKTPIKKTENWRTNKIDILKCKILEEELEFKKKMHKEELEMKILEREHKEKLYKMELQIKLKELEKYN